jgi:hypothetical protein
MSWLENGFLSEDIRPWSESLLRELAPEFSFAHELNKTAMSLLQKAEVAGVRQIASGAFLARGLQSYQAALLLLERGMLADARNVVRSIVETAVTIAGLAFLHDMPRRLAADNNKHYKALATLMLENPLFSDAMPSEEKDGLRQLLAEAEGYMQKPAKLSLEQVANEVGLGRFYNLTYRPLSGDAAHATVDSMKRHIEISASGIQKLIFKPQTADLLPTLRFAASAIIACFEAAAESLGNDEMQAFADAWSARQLRELGHPDE